MRVLYTDRTFGTAAVERMLAILHRRHLAPMAGLTTPQLQAIGPDAEQAIDSLLVAWYGPPLDVLSPARLHATTGLAPTRYIEEAPMTLREIFADLTFGEAASDKLLTVLGDHGLFPLTGLAWAQYSAIRDEMTQAINALLTAWYGDIPNPPHLPEPALED